MAWKTNGYQTDPTAGTVLFDTGAIPLGVVTATVMIWTDIGGIFLLNHRNAANTATLNSQPISGFGSTYTATIPFDLANSERVTMTLEGNVTGHLQATILF